MITPSGQKPDNGLVVVSAPILATPEDKQRLVGAFAWLIQEDKKQNPELYLHDCSRGGSNVQSR